MFFLQVLGVAVVFGACYFGLLRNSTFQRDGQRNLQSLPGPPGIPLLGNLLQIPKTYPWRKFKQWSDEYGPIMRIKLGMTDVVVISNEAVAKELLERRGQLYCSREQSYMASQLLSENLRPLLMPYGERWRKVRKFMHQMMMPTNATRYQSIQEFETRQLLHDLLEEPQDYERHFQRYSSGVLMRLAYGLPVKTGREEHIKQIYQVNDTLESMAKPGEYLVDYIPSLRYLPEAIAPFKQQARKAHQFELNLFRRLLNNVRDQVQDNVAPDCFATELIKTHEERQFTDNEAAYIVGTTFEAGSGTTAAALQTFLLALTLFQDVSELAQEELSCICGDRMPTFEDFNNLPYIQAVVKETLRWRPVTAGGFPHLLIKDDVYKGYHFPAGTVVIPNSWAMHLDPEIYPDPDRFYPTRYLDSSFPTGLKKDTKVDNIDPATGRGHWAFGFGRRACPGQHIAERSLFIASARILWGFKVTKALDEAGNEIHVDSLRYTTGFNSKPEVFPCRIEPRSIEKAAKIMASSF